MTTAKKVLIVDDSRLTRMIFIKVISTNFPSWEITQAADGASALTAVEHQKFDFISLDHNMPDTTGLEILPQIQSLQPQAHIGVFTANVQQILIKRFEALGAVCYHKPLDERKILQFVNEEQLV